MKNKELKVIGDTGEKHSNNNLLDTVFKWTISISGQVEQPIIMTLKDLWSLPMDEISLSIECVSAGKIYGKDKAHFLGVKLSKIMELVKPLKKVQTVQFISSAPGGCGPKSESHSTSLEYSYCLESSQIMLSGCLNRKPLPYKNGGPLRLIAGEERYFYKSLKWLTEIRFLNENIEECKGTWEKFAGYHDYARIEHKEKFSPFLQQIVAIDSQGLPKIEEIPTSQHEYFLQQMYEKKDFSHAIAAKIKWPFKNLKDCIFSKDSYKAQLRGINFAEVSFSGCNLSGVNFSLSKFRSAKFCDEDGSQKACLDECDFEGADLIKSDLRDISMKKAFLRGARFYPELSYKKYSANVKGLDLRGSKGLDNIQLEWLKEDGAIVDELSLEETTAEAFGYLPFYKVEITCDPNKKEAILNKIAVNICYYECTRNICDITIFCYPDHNHDMNILLVQIKEEYPSTTVIVFPKPVWLLCSTKDTNNGK